MIRIERRHTAGMGHHMRITLSDDAYDALAAAVNVAFDDPDSVPEEFAKAATELWTEFALAEGREDAAAVREP